LRDGREARRGNAGSDLGGALGWGDLIALADQHQRRTADAAERRTRVGTPEDGGLLADESGRAHILRHESEHLAQRRIGAMLAVHQAGKLLLHHLGQPSL